MLSGTRFQWIFAVFTWVRACLPKRTARCKQKQYGPVLNSWPEYCLEGQHVYILGSCPEYCLEEARAIAKRYGWPCAAGRKGDTLHTVALELPSHAGNVLSFWVRKFSGRHDNWLSAWKGKVHACYEMLKVSHDTVVVIGVEGGRWCQTEQQWLAKIAAQQVAYPGFHTTRVPDVAALEQLFQGQRSSA